MGSRHLLAKGLPWLAPFLTLGGVVLVGHGLLSLEEAPRAPRRDLPVEGAVQPPREREVVLRLLRPDGTPAEGATVVLLEPSLAAGEGDAQGRVRLGYLGDGAFRLWARLAGHALLVTPPFSQPPEEGFRFERLAPEHIPPPVLMTRRTRTFLLQSRAEPDGPRLQAALVLARPRDREEPVPWSALSDAAGTVFLEGTRPVPLAVEVYAPFLPPDPAWRLAAFDLADLEGIDIPVELPLDWARASIHGLPPDEILRAERLDAGGPLPMRVTPATGRVEIDGLPPGRYRFSAGGRELSVDLRPGTQSVDFQAARVRPSPPQPPEK